MQRKPLGKTGLLATPVGLGLAALGRPGYINLGHGDDLAHQYDVAAMEAHAFSVLDAAWATGVRYFDAARSYGRAEAFLGAWLRSRTIDPAAVTVASKWGYVYTAEWQVNADKHEVKEHSRAVLDRQRQESASLLGPYMNLYQIHSATFDSGVLENEEVLRGLADLKREGVGVGLSLSGPEQDAVLRAAMAVTVDGAPLFDAVQATWNLLEPSVGGALAEAAAQGMGVIVKEALANGRLTPRNTASAFAPKLAQLTQQAARLNTTVDALALAAALAQPWAHVVLSGAANVEHLRANVQAIHVPWDDEAATELAFLTEEPGQYWATRAGLTWN